jgi:hypothetical protein
MGEQTMKHLAYIFFLLMWVTGIVIAKGFWSTLFSIIIFPYGWYLVIEKVLIKLNWLV